MALKSNRVGVRTDQVDAYGRVISKSFFQSILDHLPRWTSLKVWKNGTEQLLPVNTDEPVTSPIVADIQYPTDSSATEQMFTYRESPTEVDGEAYIQSIKGNTIKWNQKYPITSRESTTSNNVTFTNNNDGSFTISTTSDGASADTTYGVILTNQEGSAILSGHVYLKCGAKIDKGIIVSDSYQAWSLASWDARIFKRTGADSQSTFAYKVNSGTVITTPVTLYPMFFDLTAMFGSTKADEIYVMETAQAGSGVAYFRSLFPLPYYKYDAGSLLSFNGTGIKTTGKNLIYEIKNGYFNPSGGVFTPDNNYRNVYAYLSKGTYTISTSMQFYYLRWWDVENHNISDTRSSYTFTVPNTSEVQFCFRKTDSSAITEDFTIQIESGSTPTSYEPYTTFTTTIPTDTYFPTGMKSAGPVYDEFTSSRAYTRVGTIDMGTMVWNAQGTAGRFYSQSLISLIKKGSLNNYNHLLTTIYTAQNVGTIAGLSDKCMSVDSSGNVQVYDSSFANKTGAEFKESLDGVILQYELAEEIIEPTLEFDEE